MINWTKIFREVLAVALLAILALLGAPRALSWWRGEEYEGEGAEADFEAADRVSILRQSDVINYRGEMAGLELHVLKSQHISPETPVRMVWDREGMRFYPND